MAITIESSPSAFTLSGNPVNWVFSSNQTGQDNFSFVVDLYIDGGLEGSYIIFPESGTKGRFDASKIIDIKLSAIAINQTSLAIESVSTSQVYVEVFDRYGTTPTKQGSTTSSTITAIKGSQSLLDFTSWDYTVFEPAATTNRFMSNAPDGLTVRNDSEYYLSFITNDTDYKLNVNLYDASDSLVANATSNIGSSTWKVAHMNVGIPSLVANTSLVQADFDGSTYYEVYISSTADTVAITETKRINIDTDSCIYTHVYWLNDFGSFDQYLFTHNNRLSADVSRESYSRTFGEFVSGTFTYDANRSGTTGIMTNTTFRRTVSSDWLTESVQAWLVELYQSPLVYMIFESSTFKIMVTNSQYSIKETEHEQLFSEIVEITMPNMKRSVTI